MDSQKRPGPDILQKNITMALAGDREAITRMVEALRKPVFGVALARVGNFHDAEDITHEVFIKIFRSLNSYNPAYTFINWALAITSNHCTDFLRRRREVPSGESWTLETKDSHPGPEEQAIKSLEQALLREQLKKLPPDERQIVFLRYYQGLSYDEIARITGCPKATVGTKLFRARQALLPRLKQELSPQEGGSGHVLQS